MAKRGGKRKTKSSGLGCLILIGLAFLAIIGYGNREKTASSSTNTRAINSPNTVNTSVPAATTRPQSATQQPAAARPVTLTEQTYYVLSSNAINARASASTTAEVLHRLSNGESVTVTGQVDGSAVSGSTLWYQVAIDGQTAYIHSSLLSRNQPAQAQPQAAAPAQSNTTSQTSASSFTCPRNCAGARAMGLSAQQAATCPGLDRDRDGVACYDD